MYIITLFSRTSKEILYILSEIRNNFLTFPVKSKCKEVHFKIMNHIYPAKDRGGL